MCLRPILIDNPYKGLAHVGLNKYHDCTSLKLKVPCGNCPVCISLRQMYFTQRCQMEQLTNYLFMGTLTYKNKMLRHIVVNGRKLYYADFTDFQKMMKRIRLSEKLRPFRYFLVSEYGGKNHRPHFHFILSVERRDTDDFSTIMNLEKEYHDLFLKEWRRNVGDNWNPKYESLCDYIVTPYGRTYDFHYVNPSSTSKGEDDVAFYVSKYITKSSQWVDRLKSALKLNLSPEDFIEVWKKLKPRASFSHNWGNTNHPDVKRYIRGCIKFSISNKTEYDYPLYFNRISGQSQPLSPYFQKKLLTVKDKEYYWLKNLHERHFDTITDEEFKDRESSTLVKYQKFQKVIHSIEERQINDFYDESDFKNLTLAEIQLQENILDSPCLDDDWSSCQDFSDA